MIRRIIVWSLANRLAVIAVALALAVFGGYAAANIRLDAIPDLSDLQVIVKTPYPGKSPELVEDQVTYPLTTAMLTVPRSKVVRGLSSFGASFCHTSRPSPGGPTTTARHVHAGSCGASFDIIRS